MISFRVVWNKKNYEVKFDANDTFENLKKHIESLTGKEYLPVHVHYKCPRPCTQG